MDEFAAAFGFIEGTNGDYIRGKFGQVADFLDQLRDTRRRGSYFDDARASKALLLYALLERHGDCVLPALLVLSETMTSPADSFVAIVQSTLQRKLERAVSSRLPRNLAFLTVVSELRRYAAEWNVPLERLAGSAFGQRQQVNQKLKPLSDKTLAGYFARTRQYLMDLGLVETTPDRRAPCLTVAGERLVEALQSSSLLKSRDTAEIPPTFEAVHDAFAISWDLYREVFSPQMTHGTLERIVRNVLLPEGALVSWRTQEHRVELSNVYAQAVRDMGEQLSGAARLDVVRLGLFVYVVGAALPVVLDDEDPRVTVEFDSNLNAAVQLALEEPSHYLVGHARTGRRFWTVAALRR